MLRIHELAAVVGTLIAMSVHAQTPPTTAFTYQGQLKVGGQATSQTADFRFRLYDAATGGMQIGATQSVAAVPLSGGLFTVALDFGEPAYADGNARWLEIDARSPAGTGAYVTLSPRQALTGAPYALNTRGIVVDSSGRVGIGTNTPTNRLTVSTPGDNNTIVSIDSGESGAQSSSLRLNDRGAAVWSVNKNTSNDFAIRELGPGVDRLYIAQGGNVGIGTSNPQVRLDIQGGGGWNLSNNAGNSRAVCGLNTAAAGTAPFMALYNGQNNLMDYAGFGSGVPTFGLIGVTNPQNPAGPLAAGLVWSASGGLVFGDLKQFRTPNPRQPGTDIAYACIEGPEVAAYVRGVGHLVDGRATVWLPEHFQDVAAAPGMTVQVTPESAGSRGLAVVERETDHFVVVELLNGAGTYDFDWRVEAVRRGYEDYQVIRPTAERTPVTGQPVAPGAGHPANR